MTDALLEDSPPWAVCWSSFDDDAVAIGIRSLRKIFFIEIATDELGDWSDKQEFQQLLQDTPDDFDAEESLLDFVWIRFLPFITTREQKSLCSEERSASFTLQDFYAIDVLAFKLVGVEDGAQFVECLDYPIPASLLPRIRLDEIKNSQNVSCIDASKVLIQPAFSEDSDIYSDTPSNVSLVSSSESLHFKAVQDHPSFIREFDCLVRLGEQRLDKKYRLPVLHALVTFSDKPDVVMGMLIRRIDHDGNLADWALNRGPSHQLKERWYRQIKDAVRALHRCEIIWGDVKPENVLIDHDQNAWIIDFGGGWNSGYVDEDVMETVEGDNIGVSRIGEMLLEGKKF